jgi:hypothetical protein
LIDPASVGPRGSRASYADALPAAAAVAAALASVAFFRPWVVLSANLGSPSLFEMSGSALAREAGGLVPWMYVTPVALFLVLAVTGLRVFVQSAAARILYGMALPVLAIPILVWPSAALARVTHNLTHLPIGGAITLKLWWWIYCLAVVIIVTGGLFDLITSLKRALEAKS